MALAAKLLAGLVGLLTTVNIMQPGSTEAGNNCEVGGTFRGSDDFKASPREKTVKGDPFTFTSRSPTDRARADLRLKDRKPFTPASLNLLLTNTEKLIIRFILDNKKTKNLVYKNPSERFSLPSNDVASDVTRLVIITESASLDSKTALKIETLQGCVYESTTVQKGASQTTPPSTLETTKSAAPTIPPTSVNTATIASSTVLKTTASPPSPAVTTIAAPPATEAVTTIAAPPATEAVTIIAAPPATDAVTTIVAPPATEAVTTVAAPPAIAPSSLTETVAPVSECGRSRELDRLNGVTNGQLLSRRRRVVGGTSTGQCNVIPWQVRLTLAGGEICGGSIVDASRILTAGHCIPDSGTFTVTAGDYNTGSTEGSEQTRQVSVTNVTVHPRYYTNVYGAEMNDIAVVKLSEPLDMTGPCVQPVCLVKDFAVSGQNCTISGWGVTAAKGARPSTLQYANVVTHNGGNCVEAFKIPYAVYVSSPETQLCAGRVEGGVDGCSGDDGGPLVCRDYSSNAYVLAGISSYGDGCGDKNYPGIYTKISAFYDWILEHTNPPTTTTTATTTSTTVTAAPPPPSSAVPTVAGPPPAERATAPLSDCGVSKKLDDGLAVESCDVIPWQVRLTFPGGKICGGSIIDASHILTAGHCIPDSGTFNVTAADFNIASTDSSVQTRQVSVTNVTVHPQYYTNVYGAELNDIAVVKLSEPLDMTGPCVQPVCLDKDFEVNGQNCTISGWGTFLGNNGFTNTLNYANAVTYRGEFCMGTFNIPFPAYVSSPDKQLCAARDASGTSDCTVDQGGPLVCRNDSKNAYVLAGIASYTGFCGTSRFPGIYTEISAFYDWIQEQLT